MEIKNYTCDLCGASMPDLSNMEELTLRCTAENYDKSFTYYTCPFCATIFKNTDEKHIEEVFLDQLHLAIRKDD